LNLFSILINSKVNYVSQLSLSKNISNKTRKLPSNEDYSNENILPARKSFAGMTKRLWLENHNTNCKNTNDRFERFWTTDFRWSLATKRKTETPVHFVSRPSYERRMIVTPFYRGEHTWQCNEVTIYTDYMLPTSVATRYSFVHKIGGNANFREASSRGEKYWRYRLCQLKFFFIILFLLILTKHTARCA